MFIKKLFTSKLISRNVKLQLYNTLIRPTVTYASETWVLKENMIKKLMIFEIKVMRKIFGPTRSDGGYWRIKSNQEISDILKGQNIIGFIKKQRLNWLGHVECMTEDNVQKIKGGKPMSKRPIGRPKTRREAVAYPGILFGGGVQQIQLRTEDRDDGGLGAVAP